MSDFFANGVVNGVVPKARAWRSINAAAFASQQYEGLKADPWFPATERLTYCCGHQTLDIDAPACKYRAPGQRRTCGHRRCFGCIITFDGDWDFDGWRVILKKTFPLRDYLGGVFLEMAMVEAGTIAMFNGIRYVDMSYLSVL